MSRVNAVLIATIVAGGTHVARASEPWGTDEAARVCQADYAAHEKWHQDPDAIDDAIKHGKMSAGCQAEVEKQGKLCVNDPDEQKYIKDPAYGIAHTNPTAWCEYVAFSAMGPQLDKLAEKDAAAKAAAEQKAKLEATVPPKAGMHNAALERAIAAAYKKDYDGKILKVVLDHWDDDYEKDDLGRVTGRDLGATVINKQADGKCQLHYELWLQYGNGRSFSGPFSARGGGSAVDTEILCAKVERAASKATTAKKHK